MAIFLDMFLSKTCKFILLGDFNVHVNDADNVFALEFLNLLGEYEIEALSTSSTHERGNCLDLVLRRG